MKLTNDEKLALILIVLGAASRLLHLPPNIAAVTGVTLLAGYALRNIWLALLVPIGAMALADIVLGWYPGMLATYAGMAAGVFIARGLLPTFGVFRLIGATLLASIAFFVLSNFGTWLEGWYGYSWEGLVACYIAAIPFWQNSLIADFTSTALAFSLYLLVKPVLPDRSVEA
ncbi:MAG TPA: DUF6580 family putative transport protein [Devosia sp.]|nr:DUF6580 family putative transport protein [Devosia sp.]